MSFTFLLLFQKVYVQQKNSNVFFLADLAQTLASCKRTCNYFSLCSFFVDNCFWSYLVKLEFKLFFLHLEDLENAKKELQDI